MDVMFQSHPDVTIATNTFRNVKTILQFGEFPLIEVGKYEPAGYTTRFNVYHSDGTKIAVVKGSRISLTDDGKKARLKCRFEPNLTVCELEGKTILELRREGAAALKGWAELYAPDGILVRAVDSGVFALDQKNEPMKFGTNVVMNTTIVGCRIGIHVTTHGVSIGVR